MCHVGRSCETGAEMKRLEGGGEVGCACSMAVLTGLWYFSKECESMCASRKTCSLLSWDCAGVCDWKHVCLCTVVV